MELGAYKDSLEMKYSQFQLLNLNALTRGFNGSLLLYIILFLNLSLVFPLGHF